MTRPSSRISRLRRLAAPHMLLCAVVLVLGVVLIFRGAAGLGLTAIALSCFAVMAWLLRMPGRDGSPGDPFDLHRTRHRA